MPLGPWAGPGLCPEPGRPRCLPLAAGAQCPFPSPHRRHGWRWTAGFCSGPPSRELRPGRLCGWSSLRGGHISATPQPGEAFIPPPGLSPAGCSQKIFYCRRRRCTPLTRARPETGCTRGRRFTQARPAMCGTPYPRPLPGYSPILGASPSTGSRYASGLRSLTGKSLPRCWTGCLPT